MVNQQNIEKKIAELQDDCSLTKGEREAVVAQWVTALQLAMIVEILKNVT